MTPMKTSKKLPIHLPSTFVSADGVIVKLKREIEIEIDGQIYV